MQINQMFTKDIHRPINGVVKADQTSNDTVFVELDEFVEEDRLDWKVWSHCFILLKVVQWE